MATTDNYTRKVTLRFSHINRWDPRLNFTVVVDTPYIAHDRTLGWGVPTEDPDGAEGFDVDPPSFIIDRLAAGFTVHLWEPTDLDWQVEMTPQ